MTPKYKENDQVYIVNVDVHNIYQSQNMINYFHITKGYIYRVNFVSVGPCKIDQYLYDMETTDEDKMGGTDSFVGVPEMFIFATKEEAFEFLRNQTEMAINNITDY